MPHTQTSRRSSRIPLELKPVGKPRPAANTRSSTGKTLLERAQEVVSAVLGSRIHVPDLLDRQANMVTQPAELWGIAEAPAR
ncbi:hypothetical protein [Streptomyces sp. NPDC058622]|uniref:hypothetical protein n=1 Tax=Streptomyces sp. NPDC058622 TaxID=3346562 RepID=UPI003661FC54